MSSVNKQTPISIVMTTWKREEFTFLALDTLQKNTKYPYRLILIDNGSKPEAREVYASRADIYIKLDRNIGLEAAKHLGMQFVESSYFISTDNDILVPRYVDDGPCWLERLISLKEKNKEYGAIALRPQILVGTNEKDIFKDDDDSDVVEFSHVPGYMRIMDTNLVCGLGAWSGKAPLRGHEELWISKRMREKGWKVGWAANIRCWHLFGEDGNWGYGKLSPEKHGHNPVWPMPADDFPTIKKDFLGEDYE